MNYPIYNPNNMYMQDLQNMRDRIDQQMRQAQQFQQPMQQPTAINQTFQLSPSTNFNDLDGKYANDIEEVRNTLTLKNTLFIDKENKNLWIKKADGSIKTYTLTEVIELDEKDKQILALQKQLEEMKGMILNAKQSDNNNVVQPVTNTKSADVSTVKLIAGIGALSNL